MEIKNNKLATSERRGRGADSPSRICTYCKKRERPNPRPEQTLKRCSRCRTSLYCSRACQRADWKRGHQRTCISVAIMARDSCYLEGLQSEEMAMDQLIDAYRLRVEDERMYRGRLKGRYSSTITKSTSITSVTATDAESDHSQALDAAFRDFQTFLDLAEDESHRNTEEHHRNDSNEGSGDSSSPSSSTTVETETDTSSSSSPPPHTCSTPITKNQTKEEDTKILPRWWNAEKRALCEARALGKYGETWSSLIHPAGKAEILEHYQDNLMPMKLRMVAERIYGYGVMGQSRPKSTSITD